MYNVSDTYKEEILKPLREYSYIKIALGIINPESEGNETITTNGEQEYSDATKILDDTYVLEPNFYGRVYENGIDLSGDRLLLDQSEDLVYQGYVSSHISNEFGVFEDKPMITIDFSEYVSFAGLTFTFDTYTGNHCSNITLKCYLDGELTQETSHTMSNALDYVQQGLPSGDGVLNKLEIIFDKTNKPFRDISLANLILGLSKRFEGADLKSANFVKDVDVITTKLPIESLSFTILDKSKEYNPENPTGLWEYLEEGQPITAELGYQLSDDSVEWVNMGTYYTQGVIKVTSSHIPKVTFSAVSLLNSLTDSYYKGVYYEEGITLYEAAELMMEDLNLTLNADGSKKWKFNQEVMSKYTINIPLPYLTYRENLQLIASACMCVLYTDRDGCIVIDKLSKENTNFVLDYSQMINDLEFSKYPLLRSITATYRSLTVNEEINDLVTFTFDTELDDQEEYLIDYSTSVNHTYEISGEVEIISVEFYAAVCRLVVVGSGEIIIKGNPIITEANTTRKKYYVTGEDCPVFNELITSKEHAQDFIDFVQSGITLRSIYEGENRGFPELDVLDIINAQTPYTDSAEVIVTKNIIYYTGTLLGYSKYYLKGE